MSTAPSPTWADTSPAWVGQMRSMLAAREQAVEPPIAAETPSTDDMLAKTAAYAWLGLRAADGAKELNKVFGNQQGVRLTWNLSSGVDPVASMHITVWAGRDALFTYVLKIPVSDGVCYPKVQAHASNGANVDETFRPWVTSGGVLEAISPNDVATDFSRLFAEMVSA